MTVRLNNLKFEISKVYTLEIAKIRNLKIRVCGINSISMQKVLKLSLRTLGILYYQGRNRWRVKYKHILPVELSH